MLIDDMDRNFDAIKDPSVSSKPLIPHDAQGQGLPHLGSSKALKPILTALQKLNQIFEHHPSNAQPK